MVEISRDFKGVWIPKTVWLDTRLNALEKVILTEIDSLDNGERGCWASNKHIADFCQCSERKVSEAISKLQEIGYLYIQSFDGRAREIKSALTNYEADPKEVRDNLAKSARQTSRICEADTKNLLGSIEKSARQTGKNCEADTQNLRESNTSINTSINTPSNTVSKNKGTKAPRFVKPTYEEICNYCTERGNRVDPEKFLSYYESNGWKVGRNPMKDWKAAIRNWERNSFNSGATKAPAKDAGFETSNPFLEMLKERREQHDF